MAGLYKRIIVKKNIILKFAAVVLFILLFIFGLRLAELKPLWNDELYSQVQGVEKLSYLQILLGHIPEGNNSPLFYVLQKTVCELAQFKLSFVWDAQWSVADSQGQLVLRLMPNFFMSGALAVIFYVLAVEYSWVAGLYALLTALASGAVWTYWVEARPYALWLMLSAVQLLYFLLFVRHPHERKKIWRRLIVVHVLLSITAVFGAVQVFIVSLILLKFYEKKLAGYCGMLFFPLGLAFFYFFNAPHYVFGLPKDLFSLIFANVPIERFLFLLCCGILAIGLDRYDKKERPSTLLPCGILYGLLFGASAVIMICFALTAVADFDGFLISSRYFIFLAALGIIGTTVFLFELLQRFAGRTWMTANLFILAWGLLLSRCLKVMLEVFTSGVY